MKTITQLPAALTHAAWISGIALLLGLAFDYFFFEKSLGVSFPIYALLILISFFALARLTRRTVPLQVYWLLLPLLFFSIMVCVRASNLLTALNVIATGGLFLVIASISTGAGRALKNYVVRDFLRIILLPFKFISSFFHTVNTLLTLRGVIKQHAKTGQVIRGIAFAIPILLVFLILFSSADLIFKHYLANLIQITLPPEAIQRTALVVVIACLLIGYFTFATSSHASVPEASTQRHQRSLSLIEISILLGSINVLFFLFLLIQLQYLFGGEQTIVVQGLSYAEYARRGFFELIASALFSFLLLWTTEKSFQRTTTTHARSFQFLSIALIVQVLVMIASAFKRLFLYEQAFGFTTLRLYSHAFSIFLAALFLLWIVTVVIRKSERTFASGAFISVMLFLVAMNLLNPDAFIARRNIERFEGGKEFDGWYLAYGLSTDAVPETIKLLNTSNDEVRRAVGSNLYMLAAHKMNLVSYMGWQSWHLSRAHAKQLLDARMAELEQYSL